MAAAPTDNPRYHFNSNGEHHLLLGGWANDPFFCSACNKHENSGMRYRCSVPNCIFNLHDSCLNPQNHHIQQQQVAPPPPPSTTLPLYSGVHQQHYPVHASPPPAHPFYGAVHQQHYPFHASPPHPPPQAQQRGGKTKKVLAVAGNIAGGLVLGSIFGISPLDLAGDIQDMFS